MNVIGARGDCEFSITTESEILCALLPSKKVVGVWPFNCLRRYWCGEGVFGFEAGKRSPRGEGTYTFVSMKDEEIYSTLKQFIERAKQATLQRTRNPPAVKEAASDVSTRPRFPLPRAASIPESPVKFASDSEEERGDPDNDDESRRYDFIPVQQGELVGSQPTSPFKRGGSLHHTEVSDPSPVYMKRAHTTRPRRVQQWLHTTEGVRDQEGRERREEDGAAGDANACPVSLHSASGSVEDDMYSHTQHIMPAPFQRRATDHNIVEESTYHALVHEKSATIKGKRESQTGGGEAGQGEEGNIYSIAYPPEKTVLKGRQVVASAGEEYGTLDRSATETGPHRGRTLSNLPLAPAKTAGVREEMDGRGSKPHIKTPPLKRPPIASQSAVSPTASVPSPTPLEDSMMENPMYNSQADLLLETPALRESLSREGTGRDEREGSREKASSNRGEESTVRLQHSVAGVDGSDGGSKQGVENGEVGAEIQRDTKGYSKVDKSKKQKKLDGEGSGEEGEDPGNPPPIPPRLYEGAEEESGPQGHSKAVGEPPQSPISDV